MKGWGKGGIGKGLDLIIKNFESLGFVQSDIIKVIMMSVFSQIIVEKIVIIQKCVMVRQEVSFVFISLFFKRMFNVYYFFFIMVFLYILF